MASIRRVVITVLPLVVILQACDNGDAPTAPTPGSQVVSGTVLDFRTRAPLAAVVVGLGGTEAVTDSNGRYSIVQPPHTGSYYSFAVNRALVGQGYPAGSNYRGDLFVDSSTCVSRYGVVIDARTLRPIAGASVSSATTDADGWYQIDMGCPASGLVGFNTAIFTASHPGYTSQQQLLGRGIGLVRRLDFLLTPLR
jgi:hypothetical protein